MKNNTQLWSEMTEKEWVAERKRIKQVQEAHFQGRIPNQ